MLHRATDWMQFEKIQDELTADVDVCIVPFASGGNGCFAGDYTGWPQGVGECNAHCMIVTNMLSLEPHKDIMDFVKEAPWILKMPLDHRTTSRTLQAKDKKHGE